MEYVLQQLPAGRKFLWQDGLINLAVEAATLVPWRSLWSGMDGEWIFGVTLLKTNISRLKVAGKMIFHSIDILVPWGVPIVERCL